MSRSKRPDHTDELMADAAELLEPRAPILPVSPVPTAGTAVLADVRKQIDNLGPIKPCPEWREMRKALDARDKALAKYQAAWYDTPEAKKLEAAVEKTRAEYYRVRGRVS